MARYCTKCGNILSEGTKFCTECGAQVGVPKAPAAEEKKAPAKTQKAPASPKSAPNIPLPKVSKKSAIALLLVFATLLSLFVWPGFLKSDRVAIKNGHDVIVPKGAFDEKTKVKIEKLDKDALPCDESLEAVDVISLRTESGQTEFGDDITVRFQLPKSTKPSDYLDYICGYYNGEEWEYILPEGFTFDKGYVKFGTPHFSTFALFKRSSVSIRERNHAIDAYAERIAYESLDLQYQEKAMKSIYTEVLESMGINNSDAQGIILQNLLKEGETGDYGAVLVGLQNGDPADITSGIVNSIAKAVLDAEVNDMDVASTVFGTGTSSVVSAIKSFHETGNYAEAYKDFVWAAMDAIPASKYAKIAIDVNKALINKYNDYSYEGMFKDFKEYSWDGTVGDDDWNTICIANRGGYNQLLKIRKEQYQKLNDLSDAEMKQNMAKIEQQIEKDLRQEFKDRFNFEKNSKPKIEAEKDRIKSFLKEVTYTYFDKLNNDFFTEDMDITFRIRYIMSVRNYVIKLAGGDESVFGVGEESQERGIRMAVREYMNNRKDLSKFIKYMQKNGFIKKGKPTDGIKVGDGYWRLNRVVENPDCLTEYKSTYYTDSISGAPGSYTSKTERTGDNGCLNGCHSGSCLGEFATTELTHSTPKDTYKGGETVTLSLRASIGACSEYYCNGYGNSIYASIRPNKPDAIFAYQSSSRSLEDENGESYVSAVLRDGSGGMYEEHSTSTSRNAELTVSGTMPEGGKEGAYVYIVVTVAPTSSANAQVAYEYIWTIKK